MTRPACATLLLALLAGACTTVATPPPRTVQIASLVEPVTMLDAYLFRPRRDGRHPAVVMLHGCGGLLASGGRLSARETDWATRLVALGYVVLMVDSFSPRHVTRMCTADGFRLPIYLERPKDAYGALRYLQAQPFVRPDRVAVMGWSQGGGVVLLSIRAESLGRPPALPHDFRAAVAFYPASCSERAHRVPWTSGIPLLVLVGEQDNWTPAGPCRALVEAATGRGSDVRIQVYPGAHHDFDWPDLATRARPEFRTAAGVVPILGLDPGARRDALARVTEFLGTHLRD